MSEVTNAQLQEIVASVDQKVWHGHIVYDRNDEFVRVVSLSGHAALAAELLREREQHQHAKSAIEKARGHLTFWLEAQMLNVRGVDDTGECPECSACPEPVQENGHADHGFCPNREVAAILAALPAPTRAGDDITSGESK